jgi:hypothetical protein
MLIADPIVSINTFHQHNLAFSFSHWLLEEAMGSDDELEEAIGELPTLEVWQIN